MRQVLLVGHRAAAAGAGLRFESADYMLVLWGTRLPDREQTAFDGQFLTAGGEPVARAPVQLVRSGQVEETLFTSTTGTFDFQQSSPHRLEVRLFPDLQTRVTASLPGDDASAC